MKTYRVVIVPQPIVIEVQANSEDDAYEKAEVQFFEEASHGIFEIDQSYIDTDE